MTDRSAEGRRGFVAAAGLILLLVLLPLIVVVLMLYVLFGLLLTVLIWCFWCTRGRDVLFVYSDSPVWRDYVEDRMLPGIADRAVVLNWSQRNRWRRTLGVIAFRYFGGARSYNPMAVVFRPFRRPRTIRFYDAFRDFKHGRTEALSRLEAELHASLVPE